MILPIILILFTFMLLFVGYMVFLAYHDHIRYETIIHDKVPEAFKEFRIFLIADIHRRKLRQTTLNKITESPDIVCIAGDLVERGVSFKRMRENIQALKKWNVPIYFVWGNNDYETQPNEMIRILKEEAVIILEDDIHVLERDNEKLNLLGFDFYFNYFNETPLIDWSLLKDSYTVLLTHKPSAYTFLRAEEKELIDLVLAGHTHGGQIRIFGFGPYTRGGISRENGTDVLTSEGYGYTLLPFRLGTKSECHLLTLSPPK